jgi:phosphoadenosine phosphosulfate reductase
MLTEPVTASRLNELNTQFQGSGPESVLEWGLDTFGDRIALCSAFGPEGMVLLHILAGMKRQVRVFTLDTGRLPSETHDLMEKVHKIYGFEIEVYSPNPEDIRAMVKAHGINLFYNSVEERELCCEIRKVQPMVRALEGLAAWITGLRRTQTISRSAANKIEFDELHANILKLNPLVDWSEQDVWDYILTHSIPYNALHDRGYRSIGCAPCTRATNPGEDIRAGRWWWEADRRKECGLHARPSQRKNVIYPADNRDGPAGGDLTAKSGVEK